MESGGQRRCALSDKDGEEQGPEQHQPHGSLTDMQTVSTRADARGHIHHRVCVLEASSQQRHGDEGTSIGEEGSMNLETGYHVED